MGKAEKKGKKGEAVAFINRNQVLKKLQLSLSDFRRLSILKGIYPVEPKHRKKVNQGSSGYKTYYLVKDILFLAHEPIIEKFRQFKTYIKKIKRARGRDDNQAVGRLRENRPFYRLDHVVKERYPSFVDALRDLDDCLCLMFLFARLPKSNHLHVERIQWCQRLTVEFMNYCINARALRKCFISIKGYYFQVEVEGQEITWVVPHQFGYTRPEEVDFKILQTFVEFYITLLGFINFKVYTSAGLHYPPKAIIAPRGKEEESMCGDWEKEVETLATLNCALERTSGEPEAADEDDDEELLPMTGQPISMEKVKEQRELARRQKNLFKGVKFFLNREIAREPFVFVIRCCGGEVSWEKILALGATYQESDPSITHHIIDRPLVGKQIYSRVYVQPQWVFDCINCRKLLPVDDYLPGAALPPHLSPFVQEREGDYMPPERLRQLDREEEIPKVEDEDEEEEEEEEESEEEVEMDGKEEEQSESEEEESEDEDAESQSSDEEEAVTDPKAKAQKKQDPGVDKSQRVAAMAVSTGAVDKRDPTWMNQVQQHEEKRLAEMMIPKKHRRLYKKIVHSRKRKRRENETLKQKRVDFEKETKKTKKQKSA